MAENWIMMSLRLVRYHTGVLRYIGGQTKMLRPLRDRANSKIFSANPVKMDSTLWDTGAVELAATDPVMKFVTQLMTQASDSALTDSRDEDSVDKRPHGMTSA